MKVRNIWFDQRTGGNYGLVDMEGKLYRFNLVPFRELKEDDLKPVPESFRPYIKKWWEMKEYEYKGYRVEKTKR